MKTSSVLKQKIMMVSVKKPEVYGIWAVKT